MRAGEVQSLRAVFVGGEMSVAAHHVGFGGIAHLFDLGDWVVTSKHGRAFGRSSPTA